MKIEDIDICLRYGKLLNKGWIVFSFISLAVIPLLCGYCMYEIITSSVGKFNLIDILPCITIFGLLELFYLWVVLKNRLIKKKIREWKKDAVELTAYSKEIFRINVIPPQIAIKVYFNFDGMKYAIPNGKGKRTQTAYYLLKYSNRKIKILFSPTYNEVMILKDQSY